VKVLAISAGIELPPPPLASFPLLRLAHFPSRAILQTCFHQLINEVGHWDLPAFGFMV
jgi:hypothetical protein